MINADSFLEKKIVQNIKQANKIIIHNKIKIISIISICMISISIIGFYLITYAKKYRDKQRLKNFTQYANLIESELET